MSATPTDRAARFSRVADVKFTLLLIALLVLVLVPLIVGNSPQRSTVIGAVFLIVILFGVLALARHRVARILAIALGVPATFLLIRSFVPGARPFPQLQIGWLVVYLAFVATIIIRDVLRARRVTWDQIQGAVCAYLLVGVTWGLLYEWILLLDPQAFQGVGLQSVGSSGGPMIYFSFVTLTTLGYGDITPVSHSARTLAWLEAVFGQIYLVVLVARLVSQHLIKVPGDGEA